MAKKSTGIYKAARKLNKSASIVNDVETVLSGDVNKITKRVKNKIVGKVAGKALRNLLK